MDTNALKTIMTGQHIQPQKIRLLIATFYIILFTAIFYYTLRGKRQLQIDDSEKNNTTIPFKDTPEENKENYKWVRTVIIPSGGDCLRPEMMIVNSPNCIMLTASEYMLSFYISNCYSASPE
jgi:hypothetical protein